MLASFLIVIPVMLCGGLGALVGYFYRYRLLIRRLLTIGGAIFVFLLFEVMSGTLSSKYSVRENLTEQLDLWSPFVFLYLLPAIFTSFLVARRFRRWAK